MSFEPLLAMIGKVGEGIGSMLEPVTSSLGTTDTVARVSETTGSALDKIPNAIGTGSVGGLRAIAGVSKAAGQVAGLVEPAMKAVPVGTAIASAVSKPKTPKLKMPSGPTDTAIARASTRSQTRGAGGARRAQSKAGYSSFGTS